MAPSAPLHMEMKISDWPKCSSLECLPCTHLLPMTPTWCKCPQWWTPWCLREWTEWVLWWISTNRWCLQMASTVWMACLLSTSPPLLVCHMEPLSCHLRTSLNLFTNNPPWRDWHSRLKSWIKKEKRCSRRLTVTSWSLTTQWKWTSASRQQGNSSMLVTTSRQWRYSLHSSTTEECRCRCSPATCSRMCSHCPD